jgi:hypothetical protein
LCTVSALAALVLGHHDTPGLLCALVALSACAAAVFDPTYSATVPTLVDAEIGQRPTG